MNRQLLAACLVVTIAACAGSSPATRGAITTTTRVTTPKTTSGARSPIRQSALDIVAAQYRSTCKSPGAAIGLRTSDGATYFAVSGRLAPGTAIDPESQFLAGSVTKLFVATVAYQLIAGHRLALDDVVDHFIPGWPRGDRITIAMLLGHRSGMGDFGNDFGAQLRELVLSNLRRNFSYGEVLDLVRGVPPVAQPGATYHYSNANYIVLGAIVQAVTHTTLGRLFDSRIIGPLHLRRTLYGPDDLTAADKVLFHGLFDVTGSGTPIDIGAFPRDAALTVDPAGAGLFSTLPDLLTFTTTVFATRALLAEPERSALASAVSALSAKDLLLDSRFVIHGHGGASPGAQTIVAYDTAHRATVAVWCNRLDPGADELLASVVAAKSTFELVAISQ